MAGNPHLGLSEGRLWNLIEERTKLGANTDEVDRKIWDLYGTRLAIMFTDLSGFSRQVEAFGILHFLQIIHESRTLFDPIISDHLGVLMKAEGDSLLVVFKSPARALDCARLMQKATHQVNARRPPEEQIHLCLGLGFGDVLQVGTHDVWGKEVNSASKLGEDTAKAGEILVTEAFRAGLPEDSSTAFEEIPPVFGSSRCFRFKAE
jgi:adenylate cyclase